MMGTGAEAPKLQLGPANLAGPTFSRTLDTPWSIDSQKKIVNLMPTDVRF